MVPAPAIPEPSSYAIRCVPETERATYATGATLRKFWQDCQPGGRFELIGKKDRAKGTAQKERQALNRWEQYTQSSRPASVVAEQWRGPSLAWLAEHPKYFDSVFQQMGATLASSSVKATKSHLMTIVNHAVAMRALTASPKPESIETEDGPIRILDPDEVDRLLRALVPHPLLLGAAILILYCGPRARDAFLVRWNDFQPDVRGRRILTFEAMKTHKLQGVPVLEYVWHFLKNLPRRTEYVFPGLSDPNAEDPEKSRAARQRTMLMKMVLASIGITDVDKPWQTLRRTCNERLEAHSYGVGKFVLGHKLDGVNAVSYRQPTELVWTAMESLAVDKFIEECVPSKRRQLELF